MGREFGRISGPLLSNNLLRNGSDLAFETSLLYLDVNSKFIGINTNTPTRQLEVNGNLLTDNLIIDTQLDVSSNFEINTNTITNFLGNIIIQPNQSTASNPVIYSSGTQNDNLQFLTNVLSTITTDTDLILNPTSNQTNLLSIGLITPNNVNLINVFGENFIRVTQASWEISGLKSGCFITNYLLVAPGTTIASVSTLQNYGGEYFYIVYLSTTLLSATTTNQIINACFPNQNVLVNGDLHATGDVTWDGNIIFGNAANDLIDFYGQVASGIYPARDAVYNLGNDTHYFGTTYVNDYNTNSLSGKSLNPVVSINYPFTTQLSITGTTFNVPDAGLAITSKNGSGSLNFVNDIVINGGFETGDLSNWTLLGSSNNYVNNDTGGFDTTFTGDKSSFFRPYNGFSITYLQPYDDYTIQFLNIKSAFQNGTQITINSNIYYIGNSTDYTCQLFALLNDALAQTNPILISSISGLTSNSVYSTNSGLRINSSIYQSYDLYAQTALTTYAIGTTDKIMFSMYVKTFQQDKPLYIGIGTHQTNTAVNLGINGRSGGNVSSYAFISNGVDTNGNTTPGFGQGDTVDVAVDRINGKIWIRVNNGFWNNDQAQNPTLAIGGFDISYIAILTGGNNVVVAGNFVYPGVSINYTGGFFGYGDRIDLVTITPYSVPGNFVLAHTYPSAAHGGVYFDYAAPYTNSDGGIKQTLQTYPGMTYTVSWWVRVFAAISRLNNPPTLVIKFNGVVLETLTNDIDLDWHYREYTVTATGYTTEIEIDYINSPGYFLIDNVSCKAVYPYFVGNNIKNVTSGTLTLQNTGRGFTVLNSTTGAVLPVGSNNNYPSVTQTGLTRFNTDLGVAEIYNGSNWQMIADTTGYATQNEVQNILNVWSIILG